MSGPQAGDGADQRVAVDGPAPEAIGAYLSAQRRLRGISIEELSQQTRIPLRSLERLESGSFDGEIDGFVRGFVRTVAEALGLDAEDTLTRTLREPGAASRRMAPRLSVRRVIGSFLLLAVLGGVGFAVQLVAVSLRGSGAPGPRSPIVVRRDPVRDLAEAQGVAALAPAPAAALASGLPEPPAEEAPLPGAEPEAVALP